ncbi:MAG: hypothetical protein HWE20_09850 [Gammaproteobacteria bacterium]|nr:hypothetical protein [Gammaproteobacteria bacterium]
MEASNNVTELLSSTLSEVQTALDGLNDSIESGELNLSEADQSALTEIASVLNKAFSSSDVSTAAQGQSVSTDSSRSQTIKLDENIELELDFDVQRAQPDAVEQETEAQASGGEAESLASQFASILGGGGVIPGADAATQSAEAEAEGSGLGSLTSQISSLLGGTASIAGGDSQSSTAATDNSLLSVVGGIGGGSGISMDSVTKGIGDFTQTAGPILQGLGEFAKVAVPVATALAPIAAQAATTFGPMIASASMSPVTLDMNGDGKITTTGETTAKDRNAGTELGETKMVDVDNDGVKEEVEWLDGSGDAALVDEQGKLFGDENGRFDNGYQSLARRDSNGDGKVSGEELDGLQLWYDDGDGVQQAEEMKSARDEGVSELSVDMNTVQNERGEDLMRSNAIVDGKEVMTEDVWFGTKGAE